MQTLEELKAANAAQEAAREAEAEPDTDVEEDVEPEGETQPEDVEDESGAQEAGETDTEDWMRGDDQGAPDADKKFGDGDVAAAKRKLRAKLERQHLSETEQLRKELEELKRSRVEPQPDMSSSLPPHPKWDDFADKDNPEAEYSEALVQYNLAAHKAKAEAEQKAESVRRRREEQSAKVSQAVDQHYDRAVGLAEKSGISAEAYQSADRKVREMVDSVFSQGGDQITDALIANLGEGSERVMYNLGVNSGRRAELEKRLRDDPTGLQAAVYLGSLNAELKAPSKRTTNAPKPSPQIQGDNKGSTESRRLRERYKKAANPQKAYEIRKEARRAGINTSDW